MNKLSERLFSILILLSLLTGNLAYAQLTTTPVLILPPGANNPRNSEGGFMKLKNGKILFVYTHFTGKDANDDAAACLVSRVSSDGGKTWSEKDKLEVKNEGNMNVMSVSLLRLKNGKIALFYLQKNSLHDCIPMMRVSANEGESWGEAVPCITDKKDYFVLNNDRVVQMKNGRLLMPVAMHKTAAGKEINQHGILYCYYSDNDGKSWKSSDAVPNSTNIITQEPGVIELKDGRIMMFSRTDSGVQQVSYSKDKGVSWGHIEPSKIASPVSPASMKRIDSTGDLLLVWNNNDGSNPGTKGKRTPLTTAISRDEGKTWEHLKNIETDPKRSFCYTAIHFEKDNVLLAYFDWATRQVTIRNIDKKWLYD